MKLLAPRVISAPLSEHVQNLVDEPTFAAFTVQVGDALESSVGALVDAIKATSNRIAFSRDELERNKRARHYSNPNLDVAAGRSYLRTIRSELRSVLRLLRPVSKCRCATQRARFVIDIAHQCAQHIQRFGRPESTLPPIHSGGFRELEFIQQPLSNLNFYTLSKAFKQLSLRVQDLAIQSALVTVDRQAHLVGRRWMDVQYSGEGYAWHAYDKVLLAQTQILSELKALKGRT